MCGNSRSLIGTGFVLIATKGRNLTENQWHSSQTVLRVFHCLMWKTWAEIFVSSLCQDHLLFLENDFKTTGSHAEMILDTDPRSFFAPRKKFSGLAMALVKERVSSEEMLEGHRSKDFGYLWCFPSCLSHHWNPEGFTGKTMQLKMLVRDYDRLKTNGNCAIYHHHV